MDKNLRQESIAVIGGGITGISAALELAKTDQFEVSIIEKEEKLGGLSSYYEWRDASYDRFYHVFLPNDLHTVRFIKEVGLESEIFWKKTQTAFFRNGDLEPFSSTRDFIKFPYLTLWQKFRLGLGIIHSAQIRNLNKLDRIHAHQWLKKVFGEKVYEIIWEPLLRSKLGDTLERTSAAFIWAPISRLFGARSSGKMQEEMGYIRGGYRAVLNAAQEKLNEYNVNLLKNVHVERIDNNNIEEDITIITNSGNLRFDKILFTIPSPEILNILGGNDNHPYWKQLGRIEYLGIICSLLIINKRLSPFYVINLLDKELPFTGIIETTNVLSPHDIGGRHLVYLPKYLTHDDPLNELSDDQISHLFADKLRKVFPDLRNKDILHMVVFREKDFQPIQELNFLENIVSMQTPLKNIFLVNTSMISDSTINNNSVIKLAHEAVRLIVEERSRR